jgi:hypothetical protein
MKPLKKSGDIKSDTKRYKMIQNDLFCREYNTIHIYVPPGDKWIKQTLLT